MTLCLPDVTVCAADSLHPHLAARALALSAQKCQFADSVLFSDTPVVGNFRQVIISRLASRGDYSTFILKRLAQHVFTPFVLVVQWDGYVLSEKMWRNEYLSYDYIGARWPWHADLKNVGNGGFSLRSSRLLANTSHDTFPIIDGFNEDELICRVNRERIDAQRLRIAPTSVADAFAYERGEPTGPTFGFHGLFNMWRHESDEAITNLVTNCDEEVFRSREFLELAVHYHLLKKFDMAALLFERALNSQDAHAFHLLAQQTFGNCPQLSTLIAECKILVAQLR